MSNSSSSSLPRCLILALSTLTVVLAQVKVVEINVAKYDGLKSSQLKPNQYYGFEFCLCPSDVTLQSQSSGAAKCECTSVLKGKRVIDSSPHANFPLSCLSKPNPRTCLGASFTKDYGRLYVKVTVGSTTITQPPWQELPIHRLKTTLSLKTVARAPLRITYSTNRRSLSPSQMPTTSVVQPKTSKSLSMSDTFFAKKGKALEFRRNKLLATNRVTKAIASAPWGVKDEINSVAMYNNIDLIRRFLLQASLKDKIIPTYFDVNRFKMELTTYHNIFRSRHGAPPLQYDYVLERAGQRWANVLGAQRSCLVHETPRRYGENLFFFGAKHFPSPITLAHMVTQSFYMEGVGYDYNRFYPMTYYKTGHFTQLVWRESRRLGVGVSIVFHNGRRGGPCHAPVPLYLVYVVVKYDPPGNFQSPDAYLSNVRPPLA